MATGKTTFFYIWNTYEADTTKKVFSRDSLVFFLRFCVFRSNIIMFDLKG